MSLRSKAVDILRRRRHDDMSLTSMRKRSLAHVTGYRTMVGFHGK
jgi:hypothetical protein